MVARSILFPVDDENAPLERDGVQSCARWLAALHAAELAQSLGASSAKAENNKRRRKKTKTPPTPSRTKTGFTTTPWACAKMTPFAPSCAFSPPTLAPEDTKSPKKGSRAKRNSSQKFSVKFRSIFLIKPGTRLAARCRYESGIDEYDVSRDEAFSVESNKNDDSVVNLALHVLRDLCVDRPPARANALEILLECATNTDASADERTRAKAIRLVANRLHQQHAAEADASTTGVITTNEVEQYAIKSATENGRDIGAAQLQLANEAIEVCD